MTHPSGPESGPHPTQVDGYSEALAAGLLPVVPAEPPHPVVQPAAAIALRSYLLGLGAIVVAWFVGVSALGILPNPAATLLRLGWLVASVAAAVWQVRRLSSAVGAPYLEELAHGYTTVRLHWGTLWNVAAPGRSITFRQPWDYRGLWVLDAGGAVVQAPQPGILPPGMYPSPHRAGHVELWTGVGWAGVTRPAAHGRADGRGRL